MSLSAEYQKALYQPEWISRSNRIKANDGYLCQECKSYSEVLHVHHKYYVNGRLPWEYPDEALVTLCNECHTNIHETSKIENYRENDLNLLKFEAPGLYYDKLKDIEKREQNRRERLEALASEKNKKILEAKKRKNETLDAVKAVPALFSVTVINALRVFLRAVAGIILPTMLWIYLGDETNISNGFLFIICAGIGVAIHFLWGEIWKNIDV